MSIQAAFALLFWSISGAHTYDQNDLMLSLLGRGVDLELQDTAFQVLNHVQRERHLKSRVHRIKRQSPNVDEWTAFIPDLDQQRDQLVINSISAVASTQVCEGDSVWDATHHQKTHYAFAICRSTFYVYNIAGSSMELVNQYGLDADAVDVKHVKIYNSQKDELVLLVLILLPRELKMCYLNNGECSPFLSQELIGVSERLEVFYLDKVFYTLLTRKLPGGRIEVGVTNINIKDGDIAINYVLTRTMSGLTLLQQCVIFNKAFLFFWDSANSQVLVYTFNRHLWELFQTFEVADVQVLECFKVGATHYVAIATAGSFIIYQFTEETFELLQAESREGIARVLPLTPNTFRDEAMILVQGSDPASGNPFLDVYILDALTLTFKSTLGQVCPEEKQLLIGSLPHSFEPQAEGVTCLARADFLPDLSASAALQIGKSLGLIIPYSGRQTLLIVIDTSLEPVTSPVLEQRNLIGQRLEQQKDSLEAIKVRAAQLDEFLGNVVLYNSDSVIQGNWKVHKLQVPSLLTETGTEPAMMTLVNRDWTDSVGINTQDLRNKIQELEKLLDYINEQLEGTLENGTDSTVTLGSLSVTGSVVLDSLRAERVLLEQLNSAPVADVLADFVQKGSDRLIEGLKSIAGILSTTSITASRVNDIGLEDVVSDVDNVVIRGQVTLEQATSIEGDFNMEGSLNGLQLPQGILTKDSQHGSLVFQDNIEVDRIQVTGAVDSIVVSEDTFSALVRNNSAGVALDKCIFDRLVVDGDLQTSGTFCGVNIEQLDKDTVRLNRDEIISSMKTINGDLRITSDLTVETINGLKFADDFVRRNEDAMISGKKTFTGQVTTDSMILSGLVNGKNLSNAITLGSDQNIPGTVTFVSGVDMESGLEMDTLDGLSFSALASQGVHPYLLGLGNIDKDVRFKGNLRVGNTFRVRGSVNGEKLDETLADLVYSDEEELLITGLKTIQDALIVDDVAIGDRLNGYRIPDDFLTVSTEQEIPGEFTFESPVSSLKVLIDMVNGHSLNDAMASIVSTKGNQQVSSSLRFDTLVVVDELNVGESINDIRPEDLVINGVDQTFTAPQTLTNSNFAELSVDSNIILDEDRTIDGVDISSLDQKRVTLSGDQQIDTTWSLSKSSKIGAKLALQTLNEVTLDDWKSMFVLRNYDGLQTVKGQLEVEKLRLNSVETSPDHGINGASFSSVDEAALKIDGDVAFDVDVRFSHLEVNSAIQLDGLLNDVNIAEIADDAVYRDNPKTISGKKSFELLDVRENVEVQLVNGGILSDNYLVKGSNQTVRGPINFLGTVRVLADLATADVSLINGMNHSDIFADQAAPTDYHEGTVEIDHPVDVLKLFTESVNDENWSLLVENLALLDKSNQFQQACTFGGKVLLQGDILVNGDFNGQNLNDFTNDVVLKDQEAQITGRKTFQKTVAVRKLTAPQLEADYVYPDTSSAAENAVYLNRDGEIVEGELTFGEVHVDGDIRIDGTLNGEAFPEGYILLSKTQELPRLYNIERLKSSGDIEVKKGATINGRDIWDEYISSWKINEDCQVTGLKKIEGNVDAAANVNLQGTVNGLRLMDEIVLLDQDATIYGEPSFKSATVLGKVATSSLTNGVNLGELSTTLIYTDGSVETTGKWTFQKDISVSGDSFTLNVNGSVNGFSVAALLDSKTTLSQSVANSALITEEKLGQMRSEMSLWLSALRQDFFKIEYFDFESSVDVPVAVTSMSFIEAGSDSLLLIGTESCSSFVYRKPSSSSKEYSFYKILDNTGSVSKWEPISETSSSTHVALLARNSNDCSVSGARLWTIKAISSGEIDITQSQDLGSSVKDITAAKLNQQSYLYAAGDSLQEWFFRSTRLQLIKTIRTPSTIVSSINVNGSGVQVSTWRKRPDSLYSHVSKSSATRLEFTQVLQDVGLMRSFEMNGEAFVAVAESPEAAVGCRGLKIYSVITDCCLELNQVLDICHVSAVEPFQAGRYPNYYLAVGDRQTVKIYHHKGASGFQLHSVLETGLAKDIQVFEWQGFLHVAVATAQKINLFKAVTLGVL